jgi:hypothetical protein
VHRTADGFPIVVGQYYWNNDLALCQVTQVAAYQNAYQDWGLQTWHKTTKGDFDSLDPRHDIGRLAKRHPTTNKDADEAAMQERIQALETLTQELLTRVVDLENRNYYAEQENAT